VTLIIGLKKKEDQYGSLTEHYAKTKVYLDQLNPQLQKLDAMIKSDTGVNGEGTFGYDDVFLFPRLAQLTIVKEVTFPPKVRAYLDGISKRTNTPLFFNLPLRGSA